MSNLQVIETSLTSDSLRELTEAIAGAWRARASGDQPQPLLVLDAAAPAHQRAALVARTANHATSDVIVATSGSSGSQPHLVGLSWAALLHSAQTTLDFLAPEGDSQWFLSLPTHHVSGLLVVIRGLLCGRAPIVAPDLPAALADFAATPGMALYGAVVPTQLQRWAENSALTRLDALLVGGARLEARLRHRAAHLPMVTTYGMTETCGGCVYDSHPLPNVRVRVGEGGVVELSGPMLMDGYVDEPSPVVSKTSADGEAVKWLQTADRGIWDGSHLQILGRGDDVIISGGENVSALAVEDAVRQQFPQLRDVYAWGMPDDKWGQAVAVTVAGGANDDVEAGTWGPRLHRAVREILGAASAPRLVMTTAQFPLLPSGKIDRKQLQLWAQTPSNDQNIWRR